jgi:predicted nuclease of predicted toxin-antitoxin system
MRFITDECVGPSVAEWLREQGHDVFSVFDQAKGISDDMVIAKAYEEKRILVTVDKDFGEMIYRRKMSHCGIVLLRLDDERSSVKIAVLERLLNQYADRIHDQFIVVSDDQIRFAKI